DVRWPLSEYDQRLLGAVPYNGSMTSRAMTSKAGTSSAYSAVVTTGIYCRPGCTASPKQENVRPFVYAAAAEAEGFRPCLLCRPDTFPGPAPWLAPSELVCRALQQINLGALDEGNEIDLARRLGVSERHLRRLFDAHVGATPDAVARSRRVHF